MGLLIAVGGASLYNRGFNYKLSWHYHFGRIVLALVMLYFGYNVLVQGQEFYIPFMHAARRMLLPDSKNRINESLTYEELFRYLV